jgi:hypothetical protein
MSHTLPHSAATQVAHLPSNLDKHAAEVCLWRKILALISPPPNPFKRDASWFRPGTVAERGGVYIVHHYQHRVAHPVMIPPGAVLPTCRRCGNKVQFAPVLSAKPLYEDVDLNVEDKRRKRA